MIITWKDKMAKYIEMLTRQAPIESQFQSRLYDNLNAEIALGKQNFIYFSIVIQSSYQADKDMYYQKICRWI